MSDLISRAKVLNVVQNADDGNIPYEVIKDIIIGIPPSVSAEPIVVKCKMAFSKEDFEKWAEDIKKQGENIIVIPYDAECVSAERVGEWTKEELKQFCDGISHKLLEQRSCQHWRYTEETAERIKWLEALEKKVISKMEEVR